MTLTYDELRNYLLCIWMLLITGLVIKTRLELRAHQTEQSNAPLPVDPLDPPTKGVFAYDPEDPADPEVFCYCHRLPIADGQEVICWPQSPRYTCVDPDKGRTK